MMSRATRPTLSTQQGFDLAQDGLRHGVSMAATAHAIGAAWARTYGERGALELSEALVRGIHGRDL